MSSKPKAYYLECPEGKRHYNYKKFLVIGAPMAKITPTYGITKNHIPYARFGRGGKTLLLWSGGPGNNIPRGMAFNLFSKGMTPLLDEYTITLLTRKSGLSEGYTTRDMSDDYAELIRAEFDGHVDLIIGVSYGGIIVQHFAADYPEMFNHIVMIMAAHKIEPQGAQIDYRFAELLSQNKPRQAYALLKSAVRCNDPVFINEHELMYNMKGDVPEDEYFHPLEGSEIAREGRDITLFGYNISVHWCLQAAELLSKNHGIEAEVVDLYALSPLDREGIRNSVSKTHRAVIAEEAEPAVGVGAEVMAIINEECFFELDAAPVRVSAMNVPIPYNHALERTALPDANDVVEAVRNIFGV